MATSIDTESGLNHGTETVHETVLLQEAVDVLVTDKSGVYIDGTFGRGGHSRKVLGELTPDGRLLGVDKDPEAILSANELASEDERFSIYHGSFKELDTAAKEQGWNDVTGILLDLGVSSPQIDDASRGFSFLNDGPLDMRMNPEKGQSAEQWIATAEQQEITTVLKQYGEERFAKRMANAVVRERELQRINRTVQLAEILKEANPAWEKHKHPATRAFQGIRIHLNNELSDLEKILDQSVDVLKVGGRLAVISFHSLEDRIVKRFIRRQEQGRPVPRGLPVQENDLGKTMKKMSKAIKPKVNEIGGNVRARSAVLRIAERIEGERD